MLFFFLFFLMQRCNAYQYSEWTCLRLAALNNKEASNPCFAAAKNVVHRAACLALLKILHRFCFEQFALVAEPFNITIQYVIIQYKHDSNNPEFLLWQILYTGDSFGCKNIQITPTKLSNFSSLLPIVCWLLR